MPGMTELPAIGVRTAEVLSLFLADPGRPRDTWDVTQATGLGAASVRSVLASLDRAGWITAAFVGDPGDGRPARTCYTMTAAGASSARRQLAGLAAEFKLISDARAAGSDWDTVADHLSLNTRQAASARYQALASVLEKLTGLGEEHP
jgi:PadR family transcriptional regulator PadR